MELLPACLKFWVCQRLWITTNYYKWWWLYCAPLQNCLLCVLCKRCVAVNLLLAFTLLQLIMFTSMILHFIILSFLFWEYLGMNFRKCGVRKHLSCCDYYKRESGLCVCVCVYLPDTVQLIPRILRPRECCSARHHLRENTPNAPNNNNTNTAHCQTNQNALREFTPSETGNKLLPTFHVHMRHNTFTSAASHHLTHWLR